ncbi:MAG: NAD(P)H-hydrate dehydratase [Candidatus Micrarchaeota archaeon]|nr:NAD(P)H-hydrate dehydratase [Candidatus Micrarchaeota archaeon]
MAGKHGTLASARDLNLASRPRDIHSNKRDNGRILVIGGSSGFHGAPVLVSNAAYLTLAAMRTGTGYAITCVPKSIISPVRKLSPNLIVRPLSGENLNSRDLQELKGEARRADCIVIGPGLGRSRATIKTIAKLISYCLKLEKRLLIDADAILAIRSLRGRLGRNVLITPNDHEFHMLSRAELVDRNARIDAVRSLASRLGANVLLKGHVTIISDGKRVKLVESKTATLATMGTGDVLSGIIGGYMTRNGNAFVSAVAGAYLQAKIGDLLYKEKGYHAIATDVLDYIPKILKKYDRTLR